MNAQKHQDGLIMYTEYIVKAGETTLKQVARDHLYGNENRSNEIREWKNGSISSIPDGNHLQTGMVLLLPTTKYKVQAGETTAKQIARDHLLDESRFKEIYEVKNNMLAFPDENHLQTNEELLLPPLFEVLAAIKLTALDGSFIRSGHGMDSSEIHAAPIGTSFNYKKSSITKDSNGRIWVEVILFAPYNKDKSSAVHATGWICVTEGQAHYTDPKIG